MIVGYRDTETGACACLPCAAETDERMGPAAPGEIAPIDSSELRREVFVCCLCCDELEPPEDSNA